MSASEAGRRSPCDDLPGSREARPVQVRAADPFAGDLQGSLYPGEARARPSWTRGCAPLPVTGYPDDAWMRPVPSRPAETRTVSARPVPVRTETARAVPVRTEAARAVPVRTETARSVPVRTETARAVPVRTEAGRAVPVRTETARAVPVRTETGRPRSGGTMRLMTLERDAAPRRGRRQKTASARPEQAGGGSGLKEWMATMLRDRKWLQLDTLNVCTVLHALWKKPSRRQPLLRDPEYRQKAFNAFVMDVLK